MFAARNHRGLGLVEMLVVCFIFVSILGICVGATLTGFRMFNQTNARQQLQRDAGAVFAWLQRDVESSNLLRCVAEERLTDSGNRDRLGLVTLGSWQEPIRKDALGRPEWDQVIVYSATRDPGSGRILRQSIQAPSALIPVTSEGVSDLMKASGPGGGDLRRLAGGVKSFVAERSIPDESVKFTLILSKDTQEIGSGNRTEVLEVQTSIRPRNTFPQL